MDIPWICYDVLLRTNKNFSLPGISRPNKLSQLNHQLDIRSWMSWEPDIYWYFQGSTKKFFKT